MISTRKTANGDLVFIDQSASLDPLILELVQSALACDLSDWTTPTSEDNEERIDWQSRIWLTKRGGRVVAFKVAYKSAMAHFEVLGPEIPLVHKFQLAPLPGPEPVPNESSAPNKRRK